MKDEQKVNEKEGSIGHVVVLKNTMSVLFMHGAIRHQPTMIIEMFTNHPVVYFFT